MLLEDTDNGSLTKATGISLVRGALASLKARLTVRDVIRLPNISRKGGILEWQNKHMWQHLTPGQEA